MLGWFARGKVDHPLAEPKAASRILDELPAQDALRAMAEIGHWLDSVNRTPEFRPERRFELMEQLDQAARARLGKLGRDYLRVRQTSFHEHRVWTAINEFWRLLGVGYGACVAQYQQAGAGGSSAARRQAAVACVRALRALGQQLKWSLLRYGPIDSEFWRELGRLYTFAETIDGAEEGLAPYPGARTLTNARTELIQAVMLGASACDGLLPAQIDWVQRTLARFGNRFLLEREVRPGCTHAFELTAARAPVRLRVAAPQGATVRYFGAGAAYDEIYRLLDVVLAEGALPGDIDMGEGADPNLIIGVWTHLLRYWGPQPPERGAERHPSNVRLTVVQGYVGLVGALDTGTGDAALGALGEAESWIASDISEHGYGAVVPAVKGDWLRVGALLALRPEGEQRWGVGVVRRMQRTSAGGRRVGIEQFTRHAVAFTLTAAAGEAAFHAAREERGVLLATRPNERGEFPVLLRAGGFSVGRQFELRVRGQTYLVTGAVLLEGSDEFDYAYFKAIRRLG